MASSVAWPGDRLAGCAAHTVVESAFDVPMFRPRWGWVSYPVDLGTRKAADSTSADLTDVLDAGRDGLGERLAHHGHLLDLPLQILELALEGAGDAVRLLLPRRRLGRGSDLCLGGSTPRCERLVDRERRWK